MEVAQGQRFDDTAAAAVLPKMRRRRPNARGGRVILL